MGMFKQKMILIGPKGTKEIELVVDTGADNSVIPKQWAEEVGLPIAPKFWTMRVADGREAPVDVALLGFEIEGCRTLAVAAVADVVSPLLGADILQQIDAQIDMKAQKIIPRKCMPFRV